MLPEKQQKFELSITTIGKRLQYVRKLAHVTREEATNFSRVKYSTYKAWENDKANPGEERLPWLIDEFEARGIKDCTEHWLLTGEGASPTRSKVFWDNIVLTAEGDKNNHNQTITDETRRIQEEVEFFCRRYADSVGFVVNDDAMLPKYMLGEVVAGIKQSSGQIDQKAIGQDCILKLSSGIVLLRNLQEGSKSGLYTLMCVNDKSVIKKKFLYDVTLLFAAPVAWHRKRITVEKVA